MAHWINSEPQEKPQRRKWNLQDRSSLKNLKFHIAEDGCSEVQYDLARQLLEENSEAGEQANHSLGVHWLMRAADQGHKSALEMLSECFRTKRGIDDRNECEVQSFLDMSAGERAARKAARELFACLSNGEEYITAAQLERKMREIYKIQKNRRKRTESDDHELSSSSNGHISPSPFHYRRNDIYGSSHTITEAHLVSAASHYSNGNMPSVSQALTLSVPHPQALDHIPCFHRLIFHPILFFVLCYHRFIKSMAAFPESTMSNLNFLVLLLVYAFCASDSVTLLVPMGLYYLSFVVMIIASFKMLKTKHDFIDFRMWSGLFLSYSDNNFNVNASENQFLRNNMKPYLYFFVAFFGNVMLNPIIADQWLPHSEITVVSFTLVFITMFAFMYSSSGPCPDWLILVSFGINMLAKYPYEMDTVVTTGWRFLDLKVPNFPSFVVGNGIEFCLNCRALLYLLIPGVLLLLARRKNWHGTYRYLIPHCVTLSWLQICLISSQCATMFGLVRAALGLAGLLLFLPLFGIVTLMIPVFAAVEWLSLTDPTVRIVASICTAAFAVIGSCLMAANRRTEKYVTVLQIMVCVVATAFLTLPYMTSNFESSHSQPSIYDTLIGHKSTINHHHHTQETTPKLSWDLYYKYCNLPAWEHVNKIDTQVRCSHLDGSIIKWKGTVLNVEISRVTNVRANLIKNYLPTFWADLITCWYGERNKIRCNESEECNGMQHFFEDQKKCNLNNWNVYDYDIVVRMTSGMFDKPADVLLKASHSFGNFTGKVKAFDKIWFKGILVNNHNTEKESEFMTLGKERPLISLTAIGCIKCEVTDIETFQIVDSPTVNGRVQDLYRGIKYLLNVLFNPLVTFK